MNTTKQNVKLIYNSPLWLINEGIRFSHNNHHLSDTNIDKLNKLQTWQEKVEFIGEKDYDLIRRVAFHMNHLSVSEHSIFVFYVDDKELEDKLQKTCFVTNELGSHIYTMNMRTLYENKYWFRKLIYAIYEAGFIKVVDLLTKRVPLKYNDAYEIWDCGNLVKVKKTHKLELNNIPKLMKFEQTINGYMNTRIKMNNKRKWYSQHRFIAEYFIKNPENKPQVNHINGIKTDNRIENLEWVTIQENIKHSYEILNNKPWNKGKKLPSGKDYKGKMKKVYQIDPTTMKIVKIWVNSNIAEKEGGFTNSLIHRTCRGVTKTHKGYIWKYAKETDTYKEGDVYEN